MGNMMGSVRDFWSCCAERGVQFKPINDRIRHYIAILFTWCFVKTPLTANMVTVVFVCFGFAGGALLAFPGYWAPIGGALCLQIHAVLDIADGQVARYRRLMNVLPGNPKVGMYLDLVGHVVTDTMIFLGLTVSFYDLAWQSTWVVAAGFLGAGARVLYLLIGCIMLYVVATEGPSDSLLRAVEMPSTKMLKKDLTTVDSEAGQYSAFKRLGVGAFFFVRWPHYLDLILIMALFGQAAWALVVLAPGTLLFTAVTVLALSRHSMLTSPPGKETETVQNAT